LSESTLFVQRNIKQKEAREVSTKARGMSVKLSWDSSPVLQRVTPKAGRFLHQNQKPIQLQTSASTLQEVRWCC